MGVNRRKYWENFPSAYLMFTRTLRKRKTEMRQLTKLVEENWVSLS